MTFTGADVIAEGLASLGVRQAFGIISIHNMPIFDAIRRRGVTRITDTGHEQAATHAADGYARVSGELGVVIGSTGPGTTNTITGLYEAQVACSPVLLITGQSETGFLGRGLGYIHELDNQAQLLGTLGIPVASPRTSAEIGAELSRVVQAMREGRPSPGAIELPIDLQYAEAEPYAFEWDEPRSSGAQEAELDAIARLLIAARKRLIIAGGGAVGSGAIKEITELAERLGALVLTTSTGRGAIDEGHRLAMGALWNSRSMYKALKDTEVTLALGTRFKVGVDGVDLQFEPPGKLLQVDVDESALGLVHAPVCGLVADVKEALRGLLDRVQRSSNELAEADDAWLAQATEVRDGLRGAIWKRLGADIATAMRFLLSVLPTETVLVRDTTMLGYTFVNQLTRVSSPRRFLYPTTAAIGPGLPLAVGAAMGTNLPTILISGDGGFLYHATELGTAAREGLPLKCIVINDGGYGVLRGLQAARFEGRWDNTDLGVIDFAKLGEGLGVQARRVSTPEAFAEAAKEAFGSTGPYLIDFDVTGLEPMAGQLLPHSASVASERLG